MFIFQHESFTIRANTDLFSEDTPTLDFMSPLTHTDRGPHTTVGHEKEKGKTKEDDLEEAAKELFDSINNKHKAESSKSRKQFQNKRNP
ncbi:hypothetical protein BY996DRAFT_6521335 [Phakopsora pachyrhizi]|nr:hypothetical protein BY996DRAFT_6588838 [Phakopsora pachyrhizi]KAI8446868.1 hypothetical protein BY996DRAFT_6521335 [Phakopsora pachyrhizi]